MRDSICLNLATLRRLDYEAQLTTAARAGFRAVGLQMAAVENYLASGHSLVDARSVLDALGLVAPEMNFIPDWIYTRDDARKTALTRFARFCEVSEALGCRVIVSTTSCPGAPDDMLAYENYGEICRTAAERGLIAGLEFVPWATVKTVMDAWRLVERVNHPAAGIVLDVFHLVKGGSRLEEIRNIPAEKIAIVHVNDLDDTGEDILTLCRNRRLLPGEGKFPLREFMKAVRSTGYGGWYALEVLSEEYDMQDPDLIARGSFESMGAMLRETA
ncbi:MAG: sugar phosphate isomerase/epimerase [Deltaproteobacteria bacterium]|nr:sugar phosphate isomerase/epimerase [Deltaproteobacteria bacterium]